MECRKCRQELSPRLFGRRPDLPGGRDPRCKECIREQVKLGIRTHKSLPRFEAVIRNWPAVQLQSEIDFLLKKLELLQAEQSRRSLRTSKRCARLLEATRSTRGTRRKPN